MPDRVKESVFNILSARFGLAGALPPLLVADVFAGSGSMGLESLSRGAACCWFYERNPDALHTLHQNIERLDAAADAVVISEDAWRHATGTTDGRPFDLVFLDPPYRASDDAAASGAVCRYLEAMFGRSDGAATVVVLHHRASVCFDKISVRGCAIADQRIMGSNAITFFTK